MWDFADSPAVQRVIRDIYETGGIVSAVCHGPAALVNATLSDGSHLVAGKKLAAFTDEEEAEVKYTKVVPYLLATTLKERGALHQLSAELDGEGGGRWPSDHRSEPRVCTRRRPGDRRSTHPEVLTEGIHQ